MQTTEIDGDWRGLVEAARGLNGLALEAKKKKKDIPRFLLLAEPV